MLIESIICRVYFVIIKLVMSLYGHLHSSGVAEVRMPVKVALFRIRNMMFMLHNELFFS